MKETEARIMDISNFSFEATITVIRFIHLKEKEDGFCGKYKHIEN